MATKLKSTGVEFPDGSTQSSAGLPQPPIETTLDALDTADYGLVTSSVTSTIDLGPATSPVTSTQDSARLGRESALAAGTFRIDPTTYALVIHDGTTYGGNPAMAATMNNHVFNGRLKNSQGIYFGKLGVNLTMLSQDWTPIRMLSQICDTNMGSDVDGGFESSYRSGWYMIQADFRFTGNDFKVSVGLSGTPDQDEWTIARDGYPGSLTRIVYCDYSEVIHLMAYGINVSASATALRDECRIKIEYLGN